MPSSENDEGSMLRGEATCGDATTSFTESKPPVGFLGLFDNRQHFPDRSQVYAQIRLGSYVSDDGNGHVIYDSYRWRRDWRDSSRRARDRLPDLLANVIDGMSARQGPGDLAGRGVYLAGQQHDGFLVTAVFRRQPQ